MKYQRLPVDVDPFRLVDQARVLRGKLALSQFPRLQDLLIESDATESKDETENLVDIELEFLRSDTGLPTVKGTIQCDLNMRCQRCLKCVNKSLQTKLSVVFVSTDTQADNLQEGYDTWLVDDSRLFLKDFIEDEILLALPVVVAHDLDDTSEREQCIPERDFIEALPDQLDESAENGETNKADTEKENPFAVLKNLDLDS